MISVVIPTRNPHPGRLRRTLGGLAAQTLARREWELVVVDNGSASPLTEPMIDALGGRIERLATAGLTGARLAGFHATSGETLVFVDDDNVLAPDYLAETARLFREHPRLGAAGGSVLPEWETPPPPWTAEFHGLLALRQLGNETLVVKGGPSAPWPAFAPVGAGLCVRRAAVETYVQALARDPSRLRLDRAGGSLASGGDNDMVFEILHAGWDVGCFPSLILTHLIPAGRLEPDYLARPNEGIMRTWLRVLHLHGQCPWPAIARWTLSPRIFRAWWRQQAWRSPVHHIRWRGNAGQFQGQADIARRIQSDAET